jgi:hypothetical protein
MFVAMMLFVASPNPQTLIAPRKAYAACIKAFETKSLEAKMSPVAYSSAVKSACQAEAATFVRALIAYDVAMGGKQATAASSAASDVADYVLTSEERFKELADSSPR